MGISIQHPPAVTRGIPFDITISITSPGDASGIDVTNVSFLSRGEDDSGVTLRVYPNMIKLFGEYKDLYDDDYIIYIPKGSATRFVEGYEDESGVYVKPVALLDEEFEEQKLRFPALVQPTIITSLEQLPPGQDLIFAMQDERDSLSKIYDLQIDYNEVDIEGNIISRNVFTDELIHIVNTSTKQFQEVLQNYFEGTNPPISYSNSIPAGDVIAPERVLELQTQSTVVNEGESFDISLSTDTPYTETTLLPYTITGISADDITGELTGNFELNSTQSLSTITFTTVTDALSEDGPETFLLTLNDHPDLSVSVIINDTSQSSVIISEAGSNAATNVVFIDSTGIPLFDSQGVRITSDNINFTAAQITTKLGTI
jgi:hypothetical protein